MSRTRDIAATIREITEAFADTPYPGREALFNDHCCECAEVSESYAGKTWKEITLEDVLGGRETALLNAAAWRYYLPALMIWCIRAPDTVDVIHDNLVFQLEPPDAQRGVAAWFDERAHGFSRAQRSAISAYLEWSLDYCEEQWPGGEPSRHARNALAYWRADDPRDPG